jgi:hypothetical protein
MAMAIDHIAFVVPELEPALDELSARFGLEWVPMPAVLHAYRPGLGTSDIALNIAKSIGHPRVEIIEAVPDTPWALEGSDWSFNHLAFNADDLAEESLRLGASCPLVCCGESTDGARPDIFAFHALHGVMFELRDMKLHNALAAMLDDVAAT